MADVGKRKRLRKKRLLRIGVVVMVVLSACAGSIAATVRWKLEGALNSMNRDVQSQLDGVDVSGLEAKSSNEITNVLLIGSDERKSWNEPGRSDTLMIATLDQKHKKLKLTSLMRDMYVTIPADGGDREDKLNAAYSYGGVPLTYKTVVANFGVEIDAYVVVDFKGFRNIIDAVGGVDVKLTDAEHHYLTTAYKSGPVLKLKKGRNKMNGKQALAYTRIRQDAQNDFGRTQRQRVVMQSLFTNVKSMPMSQWDAVAKEVLPYFTTDLTNEAILEYLVAVIRMGTTEIEQFRIPLDDAYQNETKNGQEVLVPDMLRNKQALQRFIFEGDE